MWITSGTSWRQPPGGSRSSWWTWRGPDYFDSAGIRLLFTLAIRLKTRRQELRVIVPPGAVVQRVLEITDFVRVVPVFDSLDAALSAPSA